MKARDGDEGRGTGDEGRDEGLIDSCDFKRLTDARGKATDSTFDLLNRQAGNAPFGMSSLFLKIAVGDGTGLANMLLVSAAALLHCSEPNPNEVHES
jgi:hypothetical protein